MIDGNIVNVYDTAKQSELLFTMIWPHSQFISSHLISSQLILEYRTVKCMYTKSRILSVWAMQIIKL